MLSVGIMLALLSVPLATAAEPVAVDRDAVDYDAVDYDLPAYYPLPWACGEGYRVTWRPEGHWQAGKARGVAFDFGIPVGVPLYAPVDGLAYFREDRRPLDSTLGFYVEIETEGGWMTRLAHMEPLETGVREVRAGEQIGYSGISGATAAHLHLELFAWDGKGWGRPDLARLSTLFGWAVDDLQEGVVVSDPWCTLPLASAGAARLPETPVEWGWPAEMVVPLRVAGFEPVEVEAFHLTLSDPAGTEVLHVLEGDWILPPDTVSEIPLIVHLHRAGGWQLLRLAARVNGVVHHLPVQGAVTVTTPDVRLVGATVPGQHEIGEQVAVEVWLDNATLLPATVEELYVSGRSADGRRWEARLGHSLTLDPDGPRRVLLRTTEVPLTAGEWRLERAEALVRGRRMFLSELAGTFIIEGPQVVISQVRIEDNDQGIAIVLAVDNVGTRPASLDRLNLWVWRDDTQREELLSQLERRLLGPGEAIRLRFAVPSDNHEPVYVLDAGFWSAGAYYPMLLSTLAQ